MLTCQFPTLNPSDGRNKVSIIHSLSWLNLTIPWQNPVEAVSEWSKTLKLAFCIFSFSFILLQWLWTFTWFVDIYYAFKTLNKLPYMSTRYLQLSHRFFFIQAISVTFYYVFQYLTVIILISYSDNASQMTLTGWADSINTLFREQTQVMISLMNIQLLYLNFVSHSFLGKFCSLPLIH